MNGRYFSFGKPSHPLVQVLSLLVFGVVLVGAVIMGAVVLAALVGLGIIAFVVFKLRAWWLRRTQPRGPGPNDGSGGSGTRVGYIEGEYEVLDADADSERREPGDRR